MLCGRKRFLLFFIISIFLFLLTIDTPTYVVCIHLIPDEIVDIVGMIKKDERLEEKIKYEAKKQERLTGSKDKIYPFLQSSILRIKDEKKVDVLANLYFNLLSNQILIKINIPKSLIRKRVKDLSFHLVSPLRI